MPDGRLPALEDSFIDTAMPELALTGKSRFLKPLWLTNLNSGQARTLSAQLVTNVDMRAAWLASLVNPTPASDTLVAMPDAGNLIFRAGITHLGNYFHLYGKHGLSQTNSGGHNQADAASFSLYAKGQLLALDAGYLSYAMRAQLGNATNHNMILVDGAGPGIGTVGSANESEAFIQNTFENSGLAYGEVATSYQGASITRKAISVRGEYYVLADFVSSPQSHQYTWQLHGYGLENGTATTGTFAADYSNKVATWQKNGVRLSAHVTATGGAPLYSTRTSAHELTYEVTENHSVMEVKESGTSTEFVSVLQPYTLQPQPVVPLALPGISGAVISTIAGGEELIMAKSDTMPYFLTLPAHNVPVSTDASLTFLSVDAAGKITQWLIENGSSLKVDDRAIFESGNRVTASWTETSSESVNGYVSDATSLKIRTTSVPETITGNGVSTWNYTGGILTMNFVQPTAYSVQFSPAVLPVNLVSFTAKAVESEAHLHWTTAGEIENREFEIEESEDGQKFTKVGTVKAKESTSSQIRNYTFRHDPEGRTGTLYYRLLQHDRDGKINNLGVRAVQFGKMETPLQVKAFPNPFTGSFSLSVTGGTKEDFSIDITDIAGRLLHRQLVHAQKVNNKVDIIPAQALPKGLLVLSITTNSGVITQKIISY